MCTKDPNFHTFVSDVEQDLERIEKIKQNRRMHADAAVSTTHFIKKAVLVPVKPLNEDVSQKPQNSQHPFMRGIMTFDDYNYSQFNEHVLLEEPEAKERKRILKERQQLVISKNKEQ